MQNADDTTNIKDENCVIIRASHTVEQVWEVNGGGHH